MNGSNNPLKDNKQYASNLTRNNHYVPQWYQKGFTGDDGHLDYLDLAPEKRELPNGKIITFNDRKRLPPSKCFFEYDLYTTFFGPFISDIIEKHVFGNIDDIGAKAVRSFIDGDIISQHEYFSEFFKYIDTQISRTPKGLNWLKERYASLDQVNLMREMQAVQQMNCTIWLEGVREIVSAKNANTKFIVSDHPVVVYNFACPPDGLICKYPNDPSVAWKASQTIFPLDKDHCLILTNLEYGEAPDQVNPTQNRTNARHFGETFARTDAWIRERLLTDKEVQEINFVIKNRAKRYIAAAQKEWLYPEKNESITWTSVKQTLLPPANKLYEFGGEMFFGFADGRTHFQDAFGRTTKYHDILKKNLPKKEPSPNDGCPCGRGGKYKKCCKNLSVEQRPAWDIMSIRERNIMFYAGLNDILGLNNGKDLDDLRTDLNDEQVKSIHELFGVLWPANTEILRLLPKPDHRLRAIYTGAIDILTLFRFATGSTLYFDEVFIQHPFPNPSGMKPEYNPIENPKAYRQQTLRNIYLFFSLYPFILNGSIDLIPDLGIFNQHLRFQVYDIAKNKKNDDINLDKEELEIFEELWKDEHKRMIWSLPEEIQRRMFKKSFPEADEELITNLYNLNQKLRMADPFSLLQDDLYTNGGQITFKSLAPGFEMTAFLSQATGAIVFTDSPYRWKEMQKAQSKEQQTNGSHWGDLIKNIKRQRYPFTVNSDITPKWRSEGKLNLMRRVWRDTVNIIQEYEPKDVDKLMDRLSPLFDKACKVALIELTSENYSINTELENFTFHAEFDCLIPEGGIINNTVQRLLVTCGVQGYLKGVPMVIFAKRAVT